jgi:hypothetical protein
MIRIEVDIAYPHHALNDCAEVLALVRQGLAAEELGDDAQNAMCAALRAVEYAMEEVVAFVNVAMRGDDGAVRPMVDKTAHPADAGGAAPPRLTERAGARAHPKAARG